jgi:hypothetical protein
MCSLATKSQNVRTFETRKRVFDKQITFGRITSIVPGTLYILVETETLTEHRCYWTYLRLGFTNYKVRIGDILSWSSFYDGTGSRVIWWTRSDPVFFPVKLWLITIERQQVKVL